MTNLLRPLALCVAGMFCVAGPAQAASLWNLHGVTFDDGTVAEGSFIFDEATVDYTNWDIRVEAAAFMPAYNYLPGVDGGFLGIHTAQLADFVAFPPATSGRYIRLAFVAPLTDAGGTVALMVDRSAWECDNCAQFRYIVGGHVSTETRVPEPGALALFALGLVGVGATRRLRSAS